MSSPLRIVAIADADSFVKWSANLLDAVPGIRAHLLLVRTPLTVSAAQEKTALAGTRFGADAVTRVSFEEIEGWLAGHLPDAVVLAGRGPFVRLVARRIDRLKSRPVVISGLPGMAIPAQRGALEYRRESDLLVVHSHREERAFVELGRRIGVEVPLGLATLPFAMGVGSPSFVERSDSSSFVERAERVETGLAVGRFDLVAARPRSTSGGGGARAERGGTDLVFAAQALVPASRSEREALAGILRRAAEANPSRRVVVKLRARPGEAETHLERAAYAELLGSRPRNLVFSHASMAEALGRAEGLVTVSSTAAVEAVAHGVPVVALDVFGVRKALLNTVFVGSGLLGGAEEVIGRRFRHPHPGWLHDNYFHPAAESDWWDRAQELIAARRVGVLPARRVPAGRGGALRAAWHRKSVLGAEDRSAAGAVALGIGAPLVRGVLAVRRARGRAGDDTWADPSTDFTLEPSPYRDSIRR